MQFNQYSGALNRIAIEQALKPNEKILCTNATVIVDDQGNLSWFDNDTPLCVIETENMEDL